MYEMKSLYDCVACLLDFEVFGVGRLVYQVVFL